MIKISINFSLAFEIQKSTRQLNLKIVFNTPILIFRPQSQLSLTNNRIIFHLGDIHMVNVHSKYQITIDDLHLFSIDLEHEFYYHKQNVNLIQMYKKPHSSLPILDNLSIYFDLTFTNSSTIIDSKLVSSVQIFLGKHQIILLQNIISSLIYNENDEIMNKQELLLINETHNEKVSQMQTNTFAIHFQLPELIIAFQADLDLQPRKVCEAIFGHFQMSIEKRHQFCKNISLRLNSLHINDHLVKENQCLFSTRCRKSSISNSYTTKHSQERTTFSSNLLPVTNESSTLTLTSFSSTMETSSSLTPGFININITIMDKRHEQFNGFNIIADAQFGEVDIKFVISTWIMLFDIVGIIGGTPSTAIMSKRLKFNYISHIMRMNRNKFYHTII